MIDVQARGCSRSDYAVSRPRAWFAFTLAFLLMAFDYIDRQVVVSMFPYLKAQWGLSDKELGALIAVISVTVALGALPVSLVADRCGRVTCIAVMGTIWSLATIACAFARSHAQLLAARSLIGLGEAGYGPAAGAILSHLFPARLRATVIGGFLAAASVGSVLGVILGGVIAARWGWQSAFGIVGIPGLMLALLFLFVRDYRTVPLVDEDAPADARKRPMRPRRVVLELFRPRSGVAAYVGGTLQLITVSTVYAWLPSYLHRYYGLAGAEAGVWAALVIVAGSVGVIVWSWVADRMARRDPRNKLRVPAGCAAVTVVVFAAAFGLLPPGALQFLLIIAGGFMMTATTGSIPAVAIDVVHPGLRASAGSMVAVVQNLGGLGIGPLIAGALSDAYGLQTALTVIPLSCLLAAASLLLGARSYERDLERVAAMPLPRNAAAASAIG
jgi:MFS transporter, Spinster family, sphingosine-1-phosphate transporter